MSTKVTFDATYGKVNLSHHAQLVSIQALLPPWRTVSVSSYGKRVRTGGKINIGSIAERGAFYPVSMEYDEGEVVLLSTTRYMDSLPCLSAALALRLRASAPKWRIETRMLESRDNNLGILYTVFEGNADILTMPELKNAGYEPRFRNFEQDMMDPEEIDLLYQITKLANETRKRPSLVQVEALDGTVKTVPLTPAPRRRIQLRR